LALPGTPEQIRVNAVLIALALLDWPGLVPRADMYAALIVDARDAATAKRLFWAAYDDPNLHEGSENDLMIDLARNYPDEILVCP
jgi:hypothetical protein